MGDKELFILILISLSIVVSLAVGVVILYNISEKRILDEMQKTHDQEISHKNTLIHNTVETQEKERKRIASDLHDDVGSKLSIVSVNFSILKTKLKGKEEFEELIDQIELSLDDSINRTRMISHELYPPILSKFGIQSALNALCNNIMLTGAIKIDSMFDLEWKHFNPEHELHLYRIFQELIHNTIKHAKADHIKIKAHYQGKDFILTYTDNGIGIDENSNMVGGLGMTTIQTRVNLLNGSLTIKNGNPGIFVEIKT